MPSVIDRKLCRAKNNETATMAAANAWKTVALVLLHLIAYTNADVDDIAASLKILPTGKVQTTSIGKTFLLTCQSIGDEITQKQWLDPQGRVIPSLLEQPSNAELRYTEIQGATDLALFFNPVKEEHRGNYTCTAKYAVSQDLAKVVEIVPIIPITFENAQLDQNPILGEDFDVKCKVHARPNPTVTWLHDHHPVVNNERFAIVPDALRISKVQISDDGIYTCRASVDITGEVQSKHIRVEVHIPPTIQDIYVPDVTEGQNAKILCNATGKPHPTFTWVKLPTQEDLQGSNRFQVNKDTGELTITNVKREDSGEYKCEAKNNAGTVSQNAMVNVIVKPDITEFINMTNVVEGDIKLTCKAFGRPPPVVTFRKHTSDKYYENGGQNGDDRITFKEDRNDETGVSVAELTINKLLRSDDGLYECVAKNSGGETFKTGHLTVEFPPNFDSMKIKTVFSWEGKPVNLTCLAESIPNATIQWQFKNADVRGNPHFKVIGNVSQSTLTVAPQDNRYYGWYKCIAKNSHGENAYEMELKLGYKPGDIQQVQISTITPTSVSFILQEPKLPEGLDIKWIIVKYRHSEDRTEDAFRKKTWVIGAPYILEGLLPETSYEFKFCAQNEVGIGTCNKHSSTTTKARSVPSPPKIIMPEEGEYEQSQYLNEYQLRWVVPIDNGEPIDGYQVKVCRVLKQSGEWVVQGGECQTTGPAGQTLSSKWVKDLRPDTYYLAEVRAHNAKGFSEPGTGRFKTKPGHNVIEHAGPLISSGAIVGIVVAVLFIMMMVTDVICCCANKTGILFYICGRSKRKPVDEDDSKLGSLYGWRFPLPYCDQKMANVAGVTAIQDSGSGKSTIRLVKHTAIDEKEPLREEKKITPIIDSGLRRETSITFDGKRSVSKTGFVGKDSAV